ncbi:putative bifunctional diguanylate cyclase/phosphodiesterase [Paenibacillus puldeungensis]|uniref:Bifunctional diguanylate cyclase/phosphodiesterase n=1 Tax=Paenibacillus puldeungensis TaxID=696536 RepID=A0ABW3RW47_9BACL
MAKFLDCKWLLIIFSAYILLQYTLFPVLSDSESLILFIEALPYVLSAFVFHYVAKKHHGHYRQFWNTLSLGEICYSLGLLSWIVYDLVLGIEAPVLSIGDLFWNLQNAIYMFALIRLLAKEKSIYQGIRFLFDTAIIFIIVSAVSWEYLILPRFANLLERTNWWGVAANFSYPVTDLVIFICLFLLYYTNRFPFSKSVLIPFSSGFIVYVVTDTIYLAQVASGTYKVGGWIDPMYSASVLLLVVAGLASVKTKPKKEMLLVTDGTAAKIRYFLLYSLVILLLSFTTYRVLTEKLDAIFIAFILTVVLITIRQVTVLLENDKLMHSLQEMLSKAEFLALYDQLSGLPNRRLFEMKATEDIGKAGCDEGKEPMMGVLFMDLDRFKYVNDSYGHSTGDALIEAVSSRLIKLADGRHFVARMGGDEFTMLCKEVRSENELLALAKLIIEEISRPVHLEQGEFCTSASIGISMYPKDGMNISTLLKHADIALHEAKTTGKNRAVFYREDFNQTLSGKVAMEKELRRALAQNELILYYQPQVDAATEKLTGAEALVRWQKAPGVMVSPAEFIPLAEETGMIVPIGEWVLRTACRKAKQWIDEGASDFHISVNVSPRQFYEANFVDIVASVLEKTGLPPRLLVLEVTEGIAILDEGKTTEKLIQLKQLGVHIAMDDFGTGYSSLAYIKQLQIDILKIAQTFIFEVSSDPDKAPIVKAILAMADSLKLTVIAEGVETEEQFRFLQENGCNWIQGYYFYRPLPTDEMNRVLSKSCVQPTARTVTTNHEGATFNG